MYGIVSYIIFSETGALLDTAAGIIAFIVSLIVFLSGFGVLVWILVRRQGKEDRKMQETAILPSVKARMRRQWWLR